MFTLSRRLAALLLASSLCGPLSWASELLSPGEHFAQVNGVRLWYRVAGHGPLLVVHEAGWEGGGSAFLQRILAPLERNLTVVYLDPRGNGKSSRPAKDTQMSTLDMADDLEGLRAFWGLEKIAVLGDSQGADVAGVFAAKHPDHVSHLILVSGGIPKNPTPELAAEMTRVQDGLAKDPRYADAVKAMRKPPQPGEAFDGWWERVLPLFWFDVSKARALEGGPPMDEWVFAAYTKSENAASYDLVPLLKRLAAPTLIIEGKSDFTMPHLESEILRTAIPHSRLVVFEKSGHSPMIEEQEKFCDLVSEFLQQ